MARAGLPVSRAGLRGLTRARKGGGWKGLRRRCALLIAYPFFLLALLAGYLLPARWLLGLGNLASSAVYLLFPGLRANLLSNARRILGEGSTSAERARLAREVLRNFSRFILEWVAP